MLNFAMALPQSPGYCDTVALFPTHSLVTVAQLLGFSTVGEIRKSRVIKEENLH